MTSSQRSGWFNGRTRLVTIVSIAAVGLAGATAVSANFGILDTPSDSKVGDASATADLAAPSTQVIDVYLPSDSTTAVAPAATSVPGVGAVAVQDFAVDVAGTVSVASTDTGLRLDGVTPAAGWTWTSTQNSENELMVTMTDGTRTLEFVATRNVDGTIAANVNEPIVTPAPPAVGNGGNQSGEHEGGEDDD